MAESPATPPPADAARGQAFFLALCLLSLGSVVYLFHKLLVDLVLGALVAALMSGMYRRVLPRVGGRGWAASGLVVALVLLVLVGAVSFLVTSLSVEVAHVYRATREDLSTARVEQLLFGDNTLARTVRQVAQTAGVAWTPETVGGAVRSAASSVGAFLYESINSLLSNVLGLLFHVAMMLVVAFYLLMDGGRLLEWVSHLSPLPTDEEHLLVDKFASVARAILVGNGVGSVIQGALGGAALAVVGIPSPVLWGTIMALFAALPMVGVSVVSVPAALYLVTEERYLAALGLFVFCSVMGFAVENVLKTKLIGSSTQMHDAIIFLSLMGGLGVFGVGGIIYGPMIVALFLTFAQLFQRRFPPEAETPAPPPVA